MVETKENQKEETPADNLEFAYELKIPQDRIAVLVGEKGATKKEIEAQTKTKINITKEGDVTILGDDALLLFASREIVQAIARGFNPKLALLLINTDYTLEIINLKEFAGKNPQAQLRLKGRVIGEQGKCRKEIERLTETHISVYGKTIAIIGETHQVTNAGQAVAMLLKGSRHGSVYAFLERKKKEMLEIR